MTEKYTVEKRAEVWREAMDIIDLMDAEILADLNYACHISDKWEHEHLQAEADRQLKNLGTLARAIQDAGLAKSWQRAATTIGVTPHDDHDVAPTKDPSTGSIPRKDCPVCHYAMNYMFPAKRADAAVDAVLDRFQQCDAKHLIPSAKHLPVQMDVVTGEQYTVTRDGEALTVDGVRYEEVGEWVRALGIVAAT